MINKTKICLKNKGAEKISVKNYFYDAQRLHIKVFFHQLTYCIILASLSSEDDCYLYVSVPVDVRYLHKHPFYVS